MQTPSYSSVAPLIRDRQTRGIYLHVTFRCPVTQNEATSWAHIGAPAVPAAEEDESLLGRARQALERMIGKLTGHRPETEEPAPPSSPPTEAELEQAAVNAFMRVRSQFAWDEHAGRWVWSALVEEGQGELARMLESVRITEPRDTRCLARMLAEVALADGVVAPAESAFFQSFTGQDVAGIKGALGAGELTAEELSETTPFLREPMLGLAWALAFTDQDLAPSEEARLARFAQGLGIAPERAALLRSHAREYVVEEMLSEAYAEGAPSASVRAEVAAAARQLGVATADYDDIERRTRRLRGLAD